jgi:hypothetical protein
MIAHRTDVVLGLPNTPSFDARARVERVDHAPPEDRLRDRRRGDEEPLGRRRRGSLGSVLCRLAEHEPEPWPGGAELCGRGQREVELQRLGQQEHAVGRGSALEVGELHGVELVDERACPVVEHVGDRHIAGDAEGHVQVGVAVAAAVHGERAHHGSGNDTLIRLPEQQHPLAESIALLDGEHRIQPPARQPSSRTRIFAGRLSTALIGLGACASAAQRPSAAE